MTTLPNAYSAIVPDAKITRYLLELTSADGESKARFFMTFGFTMEAWEQLAEALKQHARTHPVASTRHTSYGVNYIIEGPIESPNGRNPAIRSVWKIDNDSEVPSFVTAYPLRTKGE